MTAILLLVLVWGAALGLCGWLFPQALVETARRPLRRLAGLKKRAILVDDHSWAYLSGGRGETLVLLHGFGGEKACRMLLATVHTALSKRGAS